MKKILILIIIILSMSGCSDYNVLDDLAIVSSVIVDKIDNKYKIYLEIYKVEKAQNSIEIKSYFIDGMGISIDDAINDASLKVSKTLYFVDLKALIFSKKAVDNNLLYLANYLSRKNEINTHYYMFVCDDINKLFTIKKDETKILGDKIEGIVNKNINQGVMIKKDNIDLLYIYTNKYIDTYLNKIEVENKNLIIENAYIFKNEKIANKLNNNQLNLFNLFNKTKNIYLSIKTKEYEYIIKVQNPSVKYKYNNNKININVNMTSTLEYIKQNIDLKRKKTIDKLNKETNKYLEEEINDLIIKLKDSKSDIIGINNLIYKKYGKLKYNFFKDDINIKVSNKISKKGLLQDTIKGENK